MLPDIAPPLLPAAAKRIPNYTMPGLDTALEPHLKFVFQRRLEDALESMDPCQPFPDEPLPDEIPRPGYTSIGVQAGPVRQLSAELKVRETATNARDRTKRFHAHQRAVAAQRKAELEKEPPRGSFDPSIIEDRDYELDEVIGPNSRFRFRLISSFGGFPCPIIANDSSLVVLLCGYATNCKWQKRVAAPATQACQNVIPRVIRSPEEISMDSAPTLHGGVGTTFNEEDTEKSPGTVLNSLIFHDLMSSLEMRRLVGYGNRLLQTFFPSAFDALEKQKEWFTEKNPDAIYPSTSSVFSAATFELGGPHRRTIAKGIPHRFLPGASVLSYASPPGASIIIPTGVIHYSFVRVRTDETRYSLLQWAGSGITRYLRNGYNTDFEFAQASEEKHAAREERRQSDHAAALDAFPVEADLDDCAMSLPFFGIQPTATNN
ncbi:hypothetical protein B0H16DRAFT_1724770 [Mycena metata]|uniref:Uncharacterized protein n=1 Tax=Mycena metata TaxID=1033252 RepID=A0AAD7ISZ8_9AGAR|nr:hypothetical protein B0H16DRAFT_1724770 [Mycena metata]